VASVTLGPQIERQVLDVCVKLGRELQESLQDVPSTNGCSVGGIGRVRVDERVSAILIDFGGLVTEPDAYWLTQIQLQRSVKEEKK
jgi:hypothetical protein